VVVNAGMTSFFDVAVGVIGGIVFGAGVVGFFLIRSLLRHNSALKKARETSVRQSDSTIRGRIAEQLAPLLPGFPYTPGDAKCLGDPIDYVVFDGLNDARFGDGDIESIEVVLLDVKYGKSELSTYQRAIARAIESGRVRFRVIRVSRSGELTTHEYRGRGVADAET
jgi:hypothetical protein